MTLEKQGDYINIYHMDEWGISYREEYWYYTKKEAIRMFKRKYNL